MKKNFCKLMALVVVALMMMSTMAFATPSDPAVDADDLAATTVTLTGLPENEEATVLVVKAGTDLAKLANTDIIFIDQLTIDGDGNVSFPMDISAAADANNDKIDKIDVYCGYTSMTGEVLKALEIAVEEEVKEATFVLDKCSIKKASGLYGNAADLTGFKRVFLKIEEPGLWTLTHSDEASKIFYSEQREGYDCVLKTSASTIEEIIAEISSVKTVPATDIVISKYGDITSDGKFNVADTAQLKRFITGKETVATFGIKKLVLADGSGDSNLNVADTAQLKRVITGKATEVTVAGADK